MRRARSHHSTFSSRAFSELTFQVAMRIGLGDRAQNRRPRWRARSNVAVSAIAITAIVPAWTGSDTTRSTASVMRADHVEGDDRDAVLAELTGGAA